MDMKPSVVLASGNEGKRLMLQQAIGREHAGASAALFDEEAIKDRIGIGSDKGFDYVARISQEKLHDQRSILVEEEPEGDYVIITSDSVMMSGIEGKPTAINRDGLTAEQKRIALDQIRDSKEIVYVGALSWGRKKGTSSYTVLSYVRIPVVSPSDTLPVSIPQIPELYDRKKFYEAGYVVFSDTSDGSVDSHISPRVTTRDFQEVRPYVSGLTKEVVQLADLTGRVDRLVTPLLTQQIKQYPFNTLSLYAEYARKGNGQGLYDFYKTLIADRKQYFESRGGNCTFHTLHLVDALREIGFDPEIVLFPTYKPTYDIGHSGAIIKVDGAHFLVDPGLSLDAPMPVTKIPLYPFQLGDSKSIIMKGHMDDHGHVVPRMHILGKGTNQFDGQCVIPVAEFVARAPHIMKELHDRRPLVKVDFHDTSGRKNLGIVVDGSKQTVTIKNGKTPTTMTYREFRQQVPCISSMIHLLHPNAEDIIDDIVFLVS